MVGEVVALNMQEEFARIESKTPQNFFNYYIKQNFYILSLLYQSRFFSTLLCTTLQESHALSIYFSLNPRASNQTWSRWLHDPAQKQHGDEGWNSWFRLTCVTVAEDCHGLSTHCVHCERMILWDLQWCIVLPHSIQGRQLVTEAETYLRNKAGGQTRCTEIISIHQREVGQSSSRQWWDVIKKKDRVKLHETSCDITLILNIEYTGGTADIWTVTQL